MGYMSTNPVRFEQTVLELREFAISFGISGEMLEHLKLRRLADEPWYGQQLYELATKVWTDSLPPEQVTTTRTHTMEIPATWWQHAKQQHANTWWMGWLARRRPPRLRPVTVEATLTVDLRRFRVYPDAPPLHAEFGRHTVSYTLDETVSWITSEGRGA
jgi:hypothetical protein